MADDLSTDNEVEQLDDDDTSVDLEDIEVSEDELKQAESKDDDEELEADSADDDEEAEESTDEESEDTDDEADEAEEETPEQEAARFRAEMYERRQQEKANREQTVQENQQAYLDEAQDQQDLALRQLQIDAYETKVERVTNKLTNQYETALKDFPILRDSNPIVQRELDEAIDNFQSRFVQVDDYGNAIDSSGDMYAYLQAKADAIQQLTGIGAKQQEASKTKQKSKAVTLPGRSPKEPKRDADLDAFWNEANS